MNPETKMQVIENHFDSEKENKSIVGNAVGNTYSKVMEFMYSYF